MNVSELITQRYLNYPAPGIACPNRPHAALLAACEAVDRDIQNQCAITYESVQLVRAALALVRRRS